MPAFIATKHSLGRAAVAATLHRGELSRMAKDIVPWPTVANRGVRCGVPMFTAVKAAGNHGKVTNSANH